jgi:uncharacterized membrane protein YciS (DUF1049 family)
MTRTSHPMLVEERLGEATSVSTKLRSWIFASRGEKQRAQSLVSQQSIRYARSPLCAVEGRMPESLSYFEAWARWFQSGPIDGHTLMMGWPIFWWARAGKLGEFVGAASVVIDIIGPERLRKWSRGGEDSPGGKLLGSIFALGAILPAAVVSGFWVAGQLGHIRLPASWIHNPILSPVIGIVLLLAQLVVGIAGGLAVIFAVGYPIGYALKWTLWTLDRERPAQFWRVTAFTLLIVGFSFDLLSA